MKPSYEFLMEMGDQAVSENKLVATVMYFFCANTLYPMRIEARKNLCCAYIVNCHRNRANCIKAKSEIYFAHQYLKDAEPDDKVYLNQLASMINMDDIVNLTKAEAMRAIY